MIPIYLTPSQIEQATSAETHKPFNRHTIDHTMQRYGNAGEIAFAEVLTRHGVPFSYVGRQKKHHDFLVGDVRIDVKTKQRSAYFSPEFDAHVEGRLESEDCDLYVFCSAIRPLCELVEVIGWIGCLDYWNHTEARRVRQGDVSKTGHRERKDATKLKYKHLNSMGQFLYGVGSVIMSRSVAAVKAEYNESLLRCQEANRDESDWHFL